MRIATWNINSVRLRIQHVLRFIKEYDIDVMCLQETKTEDQFFPTTEFSKVGINYHVFRGEKSYNGVAILSKVPIIKDCYKNEAKIATKDGDKEVKASRGETEHFFVYKSGKRYIMIHKPSGKALPAVVTKYGTKLSSKIIQKIGARI